jgi:uncharacterized protein YjbI with pentapeptide repeats
MGEDGQPVYDQQFFLSLARRGREEWNKWRDENPEVEVTFEKVDFREPENATINFSDFKFGVANLSGVTFGGGAKLSGATFAGYSNLSGATFGDGADLAGATFGDEVNLSGTTFGDWANFSGATFGGRVHLSGATGLQPVWMTPD